METIKQEIELRRRYFKNSGYLVLQNTSTIASGSTFTFSLDERYKPYDDVIVVNTDTTNNATLIINYNTQIPCPAGDATSPQIPVRTLSVKNIGSGTIAINAITVNYRYTGYKGQEALGYASKVAQVGTFLKSLLSW